MNPIEEAAAMLSEEKVELPLDELEPVDPEGIPLSLIERLALNEASAWRELDSIPVPKRTFEDEKGRPAYALLSDGTKLMPMSSARGETKSITDYDELISVGDTLVPAVYDVTVVDDFRLTDEERGTRLRTLEEEEEINAIYDEAVNSAFSSDSPGVRRDKKDHEAEIRELHALGIGPKALAHRFGLSVNTVKWYLLPQAVKDKQERQKKAKKAKLENAA